ncbi:hypothetical protein SRHO_G00214870 [Serrasalmus rhombeus]
MYWFVCFILLMGLGASENTSTDTINGVDTDQNSPTATQATATQATATQATATQTTATQATDKRSTSKTNTVKSEKPSTQGNKEECIFFICEMNPKLALLIIGALSLACIILLTATLLLACKVCCPKTQVLDTTQSSPRRLSVDGESTPMITEISKPEEDNNQSGPEEQEKLEEPEKPVEEAAEATEVSNQASMEDSTVCVMPAEEPPPTQECEMSEKITFDDAEQP